ncbi:MAG TPA: hypothetical protein VMH61_01450 [Candidatus Acidoferrales bacterium]|nr:hypothetical protein [Candidatus Acidoferrales bacterium]
MRRGALLVLAAGAFAAGCGDPALWARWRSDRAIYHAQALERRVLAKGSRAQDADLARVEAGFAAVAADFPTSRWAAAVNDTGPVHDVALTSARATFEQAATAARRGADERAAALWAGIEAADAGLPGMVVASRLARARALVRLGRYDESLAEWAGLAEMDPIADPRRAAPSAEVLDAPLVLASELRSRGRDAAADSVLRRADGHLSAVLARATNDDRPALADGLSRVRAARRDAPGALAALRLALRGAPNWEIPQFAEELAARALEAGAPESVVAYSRWAVSLDDTRRVAGNAWIAAARAWTRLGQPDSALADYDAVLSRWIDPGSLGPVARFERAMLLEELGEWERAHAEYLALQAVYPTQPLSFEGARRVVDYYQSQNQHDLARLAAQGEVAILDRLRASNRDPGVQRNGGRVRAELLLFLGRDREAEDALLTTWRSFPDDSTSEAGALRAAALAARRPDGAALADSIRAALRRSAASATVRRAAGALDGAEVGVH